MATPGGVGSDDYYDIVLVGKTGMGKSTTGNKLLEVGAKNETDHRQFTSEALPFLERDGGMKFEVPHNEETQFFSCTKKCELLSNETTKIRVLDVPGFADTGTLAQAEGKPLSVEEGNLQIIRWLVRVQLAMELQVCRVVYFIPSRTALEKVDGTLLDELKVLFHYFGQAVFNVMVLAATCAPTRKCQKLGYDDEDIAVTREVFLKALAKVTKKKAEDTVCPPLIYIPLDARGGKVRDDIYRACVIKDEPISLKVTHDTCIQCGIKICYNANNAPVAVLTKESEVTEYEKSKCHPEFIRKYSRQERFKGGFKYVATLGLAKGYEVYFKKNLGWPWFTNPDEICPVCKNPPEGNGCCQVGNEIEITWPRKNAGKKLKVDHGHKIKSEVLD